MVDGWIVFLAFIPALWWTIHVFRRLPQPPPLAPTPAAPPRAPGPVENLVGEAHSAEGDLGIFVASIEQFTRSSLKNWLASRGWTEKDAVEGRVALPDVLRDALAGRREAWIEREGREAYRGPRLLFRPWWTFFARGRVRAATARYLDHLTASLVTTLASPPPEKPKP